MQGYRTLIFNGLLVVALAVLHWVVGVDWSAYVSPSVAAIIVAVANGILRFVTTTPVGTKP